MKLSYRFALAGVCGLMAVAASAQPSAGPGVPPPNAAAPTIPVPLSWAPPALEALGAQAEVKNSFVLDRTMLGAAAAMLPDSEAGARQSIRKLDGIGLHLYRFHNYGMIDPAQVEAIRQAYHAHGWKHLVSDSPINAEHDNRTDLWLVVDGISVRGGTLLIVTPRSVNLVTFAGDLNPIDLLRLRGHFGIPNFSADKFDDAPPGPLGYNPALKSRPQN